MEHIFKVLKCKNEMYEQIEFKKMEPFVYLSCLLKKIFQMHSNVLPKLLLVFCYQQKIQKRAMFYILTVITLELNLIFTTFKHFYPIFFIYYLRSIFISSLHSKNFKILLQGSPICLIFWSVKRTCQ